MNQRTMGADPAGELDETRCWEAVLSRDESADGTFVYGVRSTRIYCRPSCPARRPHREGVRFFAGWTASESAGYRPCKRCNPTSPANPRLERVQRACQVLEKAGDQSLSLAALAAKVGGSPYHLQRTFKQALGITPHQYAEALRQEQLKERLQEGETVTTALHSSGYGSSHRLYQDAQSRFGMTPGAYRRGGEKMTINYSIVPCDLGLLLVAATEKGICAIRLGDEEDELQTKLQTEFPRAELQRDDGELQEWVRLLLSHLEGKMPNLELPLDVRATAFQMRVWEELRKIGYGETRSYAQVAAAIGQPAAVRAVGRACATNPVSLAIPCHRVVRSDSSLAGYRWGVGRKEKLIAREKALAGGSQVGGSG